MNAHTARATATARRDYLSFIERSGVNELSDWVRDMKQRGLAANTIRQRVYLVRAWLGVETDVTIPARRVVREGKWLAFK